MELFDRCRNYSDSHRNCSITPVTAETQRKSCVGEDKGVEKNGCCFVRMLSSPEGRRKRNHGGENNPQLWWTISWGEEFGCCHAGDPQQSLKAKWPTAWWAGSSETQATLFPRDYHLGICSGKRGRNPLNGFDWKRNLWEGGRATIWGTRIINFGNTDYRSQGTRIIDRREPNSLEGRRKKKKKKNAENRAEGEGKVPLNWASANCPARVERQTLAKPQARLAPATHTSTEEAEHGSDYRRNRAGDNTSTRGQKSKTKTSSRKAKASSKTRGIKVTSQALVRETKGLATRGGQLSEDTKNSSVLRFRASTFSQRLALS